jgi:hypothetical protein
MNSKEAKRKAKQVQVNNFIPVSREGENIIFGQ